MHIFEHQRALPTRVATRSFICVQRYYMAELDEFRHWKQQCDLYSGVLEAVIWLRSIQIKR